MNGHAAEAQEVARKSAENPKVLKLPEGIKVRLRTFTPKMAADALQKNTVNRSLRSGSVNKYLADMDNGFWNLPDSAICWDTDGNLINGQHRLTAQVKGGYTITYVEVTGMPEHYQATMDNNATRSPADALHLAGFQNASLAASIATIVVKLERGNFATTGNLVTSSEVVDVMHRHQELLLSVEAAQRSIGGTTRIYPRVIGAAHWWIAQSNNIAEADAFVSRINTLAGEQLGSPILALNRRINEIKRNAMRVHWRDQFFMVVKTWNHDVEGNRINKIQHQARGAYKILEPLVRTDSQLTDEDEPWVEGMVDEDEVDDEEADE